LPAPKHNKAPTWHANVARIKEVSDSKEEDFNLGVSSAKKSGDKDGKTDAAIATTTLAQKKKRKLRKKDTLFDAPEDHLASIWGDNQDIEQLTAKLACPKKMNKELLEQNQELSVAKEGF
jgi:hypothetical protein